MKKILIIILVAFTAMSTKAQTTTAPAETKTVVKQKQVANPAAYACPKCFAISKGAGKCAHCQVDKVQLGSYYCMKCMKSTGSKPGTCPSCKGETVQITRKYCAAHAMKMPDKKPDSKM